MSTQKKPIRRLRWYAVRSDSTKMVIKAGVAIARLGVHVFIPKSYRLEKQGKWMVPVEDGLLFSPYLFIAMRAPARPWNSRANVIWGKVAEVKGVNRIMGCRDDNGDPVPLPIPKREMRAIRGKHRKSEKKKLASKFTKSQLVKITGGTWTGFEGVFEKSSKERVQVLLSLFGRSTSVEIEERDVRSVG